LSLAVFALPSCIRVFAAICRNAKASIVVLMSGAGNTPFNSSVGSASDIHHTMQLNRGDNTMRFMILIKASKNSEAGVLPTTEEFTAMGKFNEELINAGVMEAGEGLQPSSRGARVRFSGDKRTVIDGPFAETKELIAGFWIWNVNSKQEAIDWVKRCPNPMPGEEAEIEIRQIYALEDFADALTPELREQEEKMRVKAAGQ